MVSENDLWEGSELDQEDFVLVRQEDIVEGIACFMAAYLLSLKQTKVCYLTCIFSFYAGGSSIPVNLIHRYTVASFGYSQPEWLQWFEKIKEKPICYEPWCNETQEQFKKLVLVS